MSNETTMSAPASKAQLAQAQRLYLSAAALADRLQPVALLGARLLAARVFLLSGLTKWNGLAIRDDAFYLFANEYFGKYNLPAWTTNTFTVMAALAEVVLPVLLIAGLFTRFAALGLLIMTSVIQIFVYPDAWWNVHAWWGAVLVALLAFGPGALSLDRLIGVEPRRRAG